jgi:hypothetical protein
VNGYPKNPVPCSLCGDPWGFPKNGLCRKCQNQGRTKYRWTQEMDAELTRIYQVCARPRSEMTAALRMLSKKLGWPVSALTIRAVKLGITRFETHRWTRGDEFLLAEMAGTRSISFIAKALKRSPHSIKLKLWRLGRSGVLLEGYSIRELAELMGVSAYTVNGWVNRGWLCYSEMIGSRIPERRVKKFLQHHSEEYDLRRVDQAWFKGMIFPSFGTRHISLRGSEPRKSTSKEVA